MRRYRKIAILGMGVVAVVLITVVLKDPILEWWYLWKLESDSNLAQETAAAYLGRVKSAQAVPRLSQIMEQGGKYRSPDHYSVRALIQIGSLAVPQLIKLLRHERKTVRQAAEEALEYMGPEAKDATMVLVERLTEKNWQLRWYAVRALGEIGPAAKRALPALKRVVKDSHFSVRAAAAIALGRIQGVEAESTLKEALNDENESVRKAAQYALSQIQN